MPCYKRDSACRWLIVENAKIFQSYVMLGNPESLEKLSWQLESTSTNVHIVGKDLLRAF